MNFRKFKDFCREQKVILAILIILISQLFVSSYQWTRYNSNYNCREMSNDCERFFEGLGIDTYQMLGFHYPNETAEAQGWFDRAHRWLLLDFGFVCIPFESTALLFFFDPTFWRGYEEIKISEGYISDGRIIDELEWVTWD